MLKARWSGYEIDSSEAAYNVEVPQPEALGTLVRALLGSGYFVRSYVLVSEESMIRLRSYVHKNEPADSEIRQRLDEVVSKFNRERFRTIGLRPIESILNYVGANRQALLQARTFRFQPTREQKEMYAEWDYEFKVGEFVDENDFYSEEEIPLDGVVLFLGCQLVGLNKLSLDEQRKAKAAVRKTDVMIQEAEGRKGRRTGGRGMNEIDMLFSSMFGPRDPWENYNHPQPLSLRVRLNPDGAFGIHGRWLDDGQFAYGYYDYVLTQAARKARAKIDLVMIC